jgi:hypothetical protein
MKEAIKVLLTGIVLTAIILFLSSCQSLNVDTFNKQYAAGMTGVQAVYTVTAAGVESGRISKEEGRVLLGRADGVSNGFSAARVAYKASHEEGMAMMQLALAALEVLQTDLKRVTTP